MSIRLPIADNIIVPIDAYFVRIEVPLLMGLDALRVDEAVIYFYNNTLALPNE